jgi:hypothetical protein
MQGGVEAKRQREKIQPAPVLGIARRDVSQVGGEFVGGQLRAQRPFCCWDEKNIFSRA